MPMQIRTADHYAQSAAHKSEQALAILQQDVVSAEDYERYEKLHAEAQDDFSRSNAMRELEETKTLAMAQFHKEESENQQNNGNAQEVKNWESPQQFMKAVWNVRNNLIVDPRLQWVEGGDDNRTFKVDSVKALAENVGGTGGFLVPEEARTGVLQVIHNNAIVLPRAQVIRVQRMTVTLPVLDQTDTTAGTPPHFGGMVARWEGEAVQLTETEPSFRQLRLTVNNLTAYTRTSNQLLDDSGTALTDFLLGERGFAGVLGYYADRAMLRGDGVGKPLGIIGSGADIQVTRAGAGAVAYDDLTSMLSQFLPSGNGLWIAHQSVLNELLTMVGPAGNVSYLWGSATAGVPSTLLGIPIIFTDRLPTLGSVGDIMLVDLSYYMVADRQQLTVDMSTEERFQFNQTSWRATMRIDGRPWLSAPITYEDGSTQVSPFVVLGSP